ncbi:hypothetical protein H6771_00270 [Candidatus Peribacteria bacterium]|nr:hypothetical protein [Candidatus Peribacteria bacterium]
MPRITRQITEDGLELMGVHWESKQHDIGYIFGHNRGYSFMNDIHKDLVLLY